MLWLQYFFVDPHVNTWCRYAGHYIPAVALAIWQLNKLSLAGPVINMKGLAIGNGMTAPGVCDKSQALQPPRLSPTSPSPQQLRDLLLADMPHQPHAAGMLLHLVHADVTP